MKVLVDADTQLLLGAAILGLNGDEVMHALRVVMGLQTALHGHLAGHAHPPDRE